MVHAFTMRLLTLSGVVQYRHVVVLAFLLGVSDAFELPARQAFVPDSSPIRRTPERDPRSTRRSSTAPGSSVPRRGVYHRVRRRGVCFALNGLSYSATLAALS
jgi:hypothetical protein